MTNNIVFINTNGHWLLKLFSASSIVSFILIEVPDASSVQTHPHLAHCYFVYLFISSKLSRSSAPALLCSPRSPTRADPPGVSAGVLASRGVTAPGRLAPVPSPLSITQTPLTQP